MIMNQKINYDAATPSAFGTTQLHADRVNKSKPNLHYARGIMPKGVTSGEDHLRCSAPGQHSSEETSQRWQAVDDTVSDLTSPEIESRPPAPIACA